LLSRFIHSPAPQKLAAKFAPPSSSSFLNEEKSEEWECLGKFRRRRRRRRKRRGRNKERPGSVLGMETRKITDARARISRILGWEG
jgi:hypothetical protein